MSRVFLGDFKHIPRCLISDTTLQTSANMRHARTNTLQEEGKSDRNRGNDVQAVMHPLSGFCDHHNKDSKVLRPQPEPETLEPFNPKPLSSKNPHPSTRFAFVDPASLTSWHPQPLPGRSATGGLLRSSWDPGRSLQDPLGLLQRSRGLAASFEGVGGGRGQSRSAATQEANNPT